MLYFIKDGKKFELDAIYDKGTVGQVLIYGENVYFSKSDFEKYPLCRYGAPTHFVIVENQTGKDGYYMLKDGHGNIFKLPHKNFSHQYLYDAQEWLTWNKAREENAMDAVKRTINNLEYDWEVFLKHHD